MKGNYIFTFLDNKLRCIVRDDNGSNIYTGERAYALFKKVNKVNISSIKVQERNNNDKKSLYFRLKGDNCTITIKNLEQFYRSNLFEELTNHERKFEKAIDKYEKKKKKNQNIKVRNFVLGALITSMVASGAVGFSLNKDRSSEVSHNNYKITYEEANSDDYEIIDEEVIEEEIAKDVNEELDQIMEENTDVSEKEYLFENNTDSETFKYVDENYGELITKIAEKRGISPNLLEAMVTQESGGRYANLMQIQFWSFKDMEVSAYNYDTDEMEKICCTNNPENHPGCICYSESDLLNPEINLDVGGVILQYNADKYFDYNVNLTLQSYNFGPGNVNYFLDIMEDATGKTFEEIVNDRDSLEFLDYTHYITVGDPDYIPHVMRYVKNPEDGIYILSHRNGETEKHEFSLVREVQQKSNNL